MNFRIILMDYMSLYIFFQKTKVRKKYEIKKQFTKKPLV